MFADRLQKPGFEVKCQWLDPKDPDFHVAKKLTVRSKRPVAEAAFALKRRGDVLIHELQGIGNTIKFALEWDCEKLILNTDSKLAQQLLNSNLELLGEQGGEWKELSRI
ncbi:hypothetical protein GIB67_012907 [Kingdonia uniflora]|uniref:Uncharacterized protein n=1 Tax=Kingdonia uniflora TaxID=39325 RepID=A0A7J7NG77_9MAGN|nr:hypothetical protein GIB67_012907 [Kingdonia uniflora]